LQQCRRKGLGLLTVIYGGSGGTFGSVFTSSTTGRSDANASSNAAPSRDHHVEEEESELFPELRKTKLDLAKLGERIAATRREALQSRITKVATSH
jgi:hypothetical protein